MRRAHIPVDSHTLLGDRVRRAGLSLMADEEEAWPSLRGDHPPLYRGSAKGPALNIGLRLSGLALIGLAAAALYRMYGLIHSGGHWFGMLPGYLLALIGFVGASGGCVLLFLGTHIFDEIEISDRWQPRG